VLGRKVIPDWAIALLAVGFTLPALVASVDAFARGRRRNLPIAHRMRWALAATLPFAITLLGAFVFQLAGWLPDSVSSALAPATSPTAGEALPALAVLALMFALCWLLVRPAMAGHATRAPGHGRANRLGTADPTATAALALLLSIEVLLVCVFNPFTALVLVPAAHLAVLAALPQGPRRTILGGATLAVALSLPALAVVYYGMRLDLGLDVSSYALMLVGAATGSPLTGLVLSVVAGTLVSAVILDFAGQEREADVAITVRGPAGYAGPGSLGGTESALRRQ
jgi:hypothetical protein